MAHPVGNDYSNIPPPSHGNSVSDDAVIEDDFIVRYNTKLDDPVAEAERWYRACDMNVSIAEGKLSGAMGATRKHIGKRNLAEWKQRKHQARVAMNRARKAAA